MNHEFRGQPVSFGEPRFARGAAADLVALVEQLRPSRAMNRPVNAAAAQEGRVGRVHDGVHGQSGDVGLQNLDLACHGIRLPEEILAPQPPRRHRCAQGAHFSTVM
jgi:hypothetical protein